jgi:hypothetical protein
VNLLGVAVTMPVFECMDNLTNYIEGSVEITQGYMILELGKTGSYTGTTPAGFSLVEIGVPI